MSDIYQKASQVIVWLDCVLNFQDTAIPDLALCTQYCYRTADESHWTHCTWFRGLMFHPYWRRLWIIQEVLLAASLTIWYGFDIIPWQHMAFYYDLCDVPSQVHFLVFEKLGVRKNLLSLVQVAAISHASECEDPRDKLYGIQALIQEEHRQTIDYAKTPSEVFADAAFILLTANEPLTNHPSILSKLAWEMGLGYNSARWELVINFAATGYIRHGYTFCQLQEQLKLVIGYISDKRTHLFASWAEEHRYSTVMSNYEWQVVTIDWTPESDPDRRMIAREHSD